MRMPARVLLAAGLLLPGLAGASKPSLPSTEANPPILVQIVLPEGGVRQIALDEAMVRETTGRNVFYDVDAFLEAAFRRLDLDYKQVCEGKGERRICSIKRIAKWANSPSHHWELIRDGYRDRLGINNVNHLGVKTLRYEYQDLRNP
jgi:hypothetical protein